MGAAGRGCGAWIRLRDANEDFPEQERREAIPRLKLEDLLRVAKRFLILIPIGFDLRAGVISERVIGVAHENFMDLGQRWAEFTLCLESDGEPDARIGVGRIPCERRLQVLNGLIVGLNFDIEIAKGGERGGAFGMAAAGLVEDAAGFVVVVDAAVGTREADFGIHVCRRTLQDYLEAGDCGGEIARGKSVFGVEGQLREALRGSLSLQGPEGKNCRGKQEMHRRKQCARNDALVPRRKIKNARKHGAIIASANGAGRCTGALAHD